MLNRMFNNDVTAGYIASFDETSSDFDLPKICSYLQRGAKSSSKNKQNHTLAEMMLNQGTATLFTVFNKGSNIQNAANGSQFMADICRNINMLTENNYTLQNHEIQLMSQLKLFISAFDKIESPYNTNNVHNNFIEAIQYLNQMITKNTQFVSKKL